MRKNIARLSVDCTPLERQKIKVLSSLSGETMTEWVMDAVREKMKKESSRLPNEKTTKALLDSQEGKGVKDYGNIEELFEDLGI